MLLAKLGFESGQAGPRGALFSWVTMTEAGLLVTGVWNSKRDFEQFATEFGSFAAEVGVRGPPQITFHKVHSYLTAGARGRRPRPRTSRTRWRTARSRAWSSTPR